MAYQDPVAAPATLVRRGKLCSRHTHPRPSCHMLVQCLGSIDTEQTEEDSKEASI